MSDETKARQEDGKFVVYDDDGNWISSEDTEDLAENQ